MKGKLTRVILLLGVVASLLFASLPATIIKAADIGEQLIVGSGYDSMSTASVEWNCLLNGGRWDATERDSWQIVSTPGVIKSLKITCNAPGTSKSRTFTLRKGTTEGNMADTALTVTISGSSTTGEDTTHEVAVSQGDFITLENHPSGSPLSGYGAWSAVFVPDTTNETITSSCSYWTEVNGTYYTGIMNGYNYIIPAATGYTGQVMPTDGTLTNLVARCASALAADDTVTITLQKNDEDTALTISLTDGETYDADTTHEIDVAAGDLVRTKVVVNDMTDGSAQSAAIGYTFVADTNGESLLMGGSYDDLSTSGSEYCPAVTGFKDGMTWNSSDDTGFGSPYELTLVQSGWTIKNLYCWLTTAPTTGKSYTFTIRKNRSNQALTVTIADDAVSGNDTAHSFTTADYDNISIVSTKSGTPAVADGYWSMVAYKSPLSAPTVTTQAATDKEDNTATGNGTITLSGGVNATERGFDWDVDTGEPYANNVHEHGDFSAGVFALSLTSLPTGTTIYCRAYAINTEGTGEGSEVSFLTKPAAPTNVSATDGSDTAKVVITWTKSTGATNYHVWRGAVDLGAAGDVATFDDSGADAPVITPGMASASDGTSNAYVTLSLAGESVANGTTHTYKVVASNATGNSDDSATNTGYRGHGTLTYQWQRSAADSDASYSNITDATTDPYNDTEAPANGDGRYFKCVLNATGATQQTSTADRGFRGIACTVTTQATTDKEDDTATGNGNITSLNGGSNATERGMDWDTNSGEPYANNVHTHGDYGTGAFTVSLTGLPTGTTIYCRAYAVNDLGTGKGTEVTFLTKPAAPTAVSATDGGYTSKVTITWTKSTGATDYHVWRDAVDLGAAGDVATFDDEGADAPVVTPGTAAASDGISTLFVTLTVSGESVANGTTHTYKVVASNATGNSVDSSTNTGYIGHGPLTYQWQRSAADSDAAYSSIESGTTNPYDDTGAPANGDGRYFKCSVSATGAAMQTTTANRGYKMPPPTPGEPNMLGIYNFSTRVSLVNMDGSKQSQTRTGSLTIIAQDGQEIIDASFWLDGVIAEEDAITLNGWVGTGTKPVMILWGTDETTGVTMRIKTLVVLRKGALNSIKGWLDGIQEDSNFDEIITYTVSFKALWTITP